MRTRQYVLSIVTALGALGSATPAVRAQVPWTPEWAEILSHMSIVHLDDGQGGTVKTIRLSGANFQIVNGLGTTFTPNGVGNLIVGYNEAGNPNGDDRTGSHNVVTGFANNFSAVGGLVTGAQNSITGSWASVSGGRLNQATNSYASVSGGFSGTASGVDSAVSGGVFNTASSSASWAGGGWGNTASTSTASAVSGGYKNTASQFRQRR